MNTHSTEDKDHFDLLPFIAILMCTLGCLLFVTLSVAALSIGPERGEGWIVARATANDKTPVLVEWDGTVAVLHRDGHHLKVAWEGADAPPPVVGPDGPQGSPPVFLPGTPGAAAEAGPSERLSFKEMMTWFYENRRTQYALFAVRPSGFGNFDDFADEFRDRGIKVGYEPIAQGRTVTLMKGEGSHE